MSRGAQLDPAEIEHASSIESRLVPIDSAVLLPQSEYEPELGIRAVLNAYPIEIPPLSLALASEELLAANQDGPIPYLPGIDGYPVMHAPHTMHLHNILDDALLGPSDTDLTFIRASGKQNGVFVGNLHHDIRYTGYNQYNVERNGHVERPSDGFEIWRQIVNLGDTPRYLQVIDKPMSDFEGTEQDTDTFRRFSEFVAGQTIADIPSDVLEPEPVRGQSLILEVPPYDGKTLYALEFWSSRILHAGITDHNGHFMVAAGAWRSLSDIARTDD